MPIINNAPFNRANPIFTVNDSSERGVNIQLDRGWIQRTPNSFSYANGAITKPELALLGLKSGERYQVTFFVDRFNFKEIGASLEIYAGIANGNTPNFVVVPANVGTAINIELIAGSDNALLRFVVDSRDTVENIQLSMMKVIKL